MKFFDFTLDGYEADREDTDKLKEVVNGHVWFEMEVTEGVKPPYADHLFTHQGVGVWYDCSTDTYLFTDETGE